MASFITPPGSWEHFANDAPVSHDNKTEDKKHDSQKDDSKPDCKKRESKRSCFDTG